MTKLSLLNSRIGFYSILIFLLSSCSPAYVIKAAYEESKILLKREKIEDYIASEQASSDEKIKLQLVLEARAYAESIGLNPRGSFKYYSKLDRDEASWVLTACPKYKLEPYTWWFPIVGRVPYKGFFDKASAEQEAKKLEEQGYETSIRPADAFSTLGWFSDPLLSPVLKYEPEAIVNLVIHESLHSTYWIPGDVSNNESMANFIGLRGALGFFANKAEADPTFKSHFHKAAENFNNEVTFAKLINQFYMDLSVLYDSSLPLHTLQSKKEEQFKKHNRLINRHFPYFKTINSNPEILQIKIYLGKPF